MVEGILVHIIALIGGLILWVAILLSLCIIFYIGVMVVIEAITGKNYDPYYNNWVKKFRYIVILIWLTLSFTTSMYYGIKFDTQLKPLVWQKGFYEEVISHE